MQPTLPQQTGGIADMDLTAVQSMDWLFKKERIYLLAQFWQQRATLAEKEVNTLKEQLSTCTDLTTQTSSQISTLSPTSTTASPIICQEISISTPVSNTIPISNNISDKNFQLSSPTKLINSSSDISINIPSPPPSQNIIHQHQQLNQPQYQLQNGGLLTEAPSPSPPLSDSGNITPASSTKNSIINSSCNSSNLRVNRQIISLNNNKMADTNDRIDSSTLKTVAADMKRVDFFQQQQQQISGCQTVDKKNSTGDRIKEISSHSPKLNQLHEIDEDTECNINININTCTSENSNNNNNNNKLTNIQNNNNSNNSNSTRSLSEELAAKDKELKILIDEVSRLQTLHERNIEEIQKLKENLNGKIEVISNLQSQLKVTNEDSESKLSKPTIKEERDEISSIDSPLPTAVVAIDDDPIQDVLLENTKVLGAAQHKDKRDIYNSDEPTEQLNLFASNEINKKYINSYNCSSPEPSTIPTISLIESSINYLNNTPNSKNAKINNSNNKNIDHNIESSACTDITKIHAQNSKDDEELNKINVSNEQTKDSSNLSSVPESFHNVEQFGTILGEELIKKYWPRTFDIPPLPHSNNSLSILPNENIQHNTLLSLKPIIDDGGQIQGTPLSELATTANKTPVLSSYQNIIPTTSTLEPSSTTLLSQLVNSTFSNSLRTDNSCISSTNNNNSHNHLHQDMDKSSGRNSTTSTPNLHDGRHSTDDHIGTGGMSSGILNPISLNKNNCNEDNNLGSLTHIPGNFLPGIPFQFQDRNHFRFSDDIQMSGSMAGRLGESLIPKGDPMEAKLQEMLRYNMDKYANQNLDTLHISRRVRELLSVHNIGQRLFAKYVLGLSQGTVSELLSKPKPWDKLTEKGRDSYRKMHAWACDDTAVLLLKSLIPKKGSDPGMPQYSRSDDSMSDDRIAHILSEASQMMKNPTSLNSNIHHQPQHIHHQFHQQQHSLMEHGGERDDLNSNEDSKSPIHSRCQSPAFKENQPRQRKSDEMSQDKITKIYQEELAKIMSRSQRESFPSGGVPLNPNIPQMPDDNIRVAMEAYHRELSKLQQTGGTIPNFPNLSGLLALQHQATATINGSAQDLSISKEKGFKQTQEQYNGQINCPSEQSDQNTKDSVTSEDQRHSSAFSLVRPKQEPGSYPNNSSASVGTSSAAASPLGNLILPPAMTPNEDFSSAASPLQRMASITNSLITQPPVTPHHSQPQRPMKAVLPPITQQQFDMFNNLNTEDIVRRVKEALSQYSISQRLFGESVLGLSQGSVSDLLARPKPWHMLTQKGREPFIRMKMFLEDDNAVHKLVASQYKIAPEKLMRTGNYSGSPQIPTGLTNKMGNMANMANMANLPMQKIMNELKMQENTPQHIMQQMQASVLAHIPTSQHQGMLLTPPGMPPHHAISLTNSTEKKTMTLPVQSTQQANAMRGLHQHMSPTVYEMAALTQDLDTQIITTKIKEALLANNIGQKIFGEAVLGLSQGSVSELLSKPKPWHMLSIKGREPFIRMQLWLSDGNNVERLQLLKNERREASKRRRSTGPGGNQDNSSDTSSNDTNDFYTNSPGPGSVGSSGAPPNKKQRVLFSEEQKEALRLAFALDPYPNVATIEFLANELNLATRTITNWFHNHRMRLKQQVPHGAPMEPMPSRENPPATPFDPIQFRILLNQRLVELQKDRMGISGIPIPYPSYFAANPNLAALIGRGLLPTNESELQALNAAFREQMNGLDLSMGGSVKRERDDEFDDEADADNDNDLSDSESVDGETKSDNQKEDSFMSMSHGLQSRTSRRKPAAPQWVNPDWQGVAGSAPVDLVKNLNNKTENEVIINGVCVMQQQQADDYSRKSGTVPLQSESNTNTIELKDNNSDILDNDNELKNTECVGGNNSTKNDDITTVTTDITNSSLNILDDIKIDNTDNNSEEFNRNKKELLIHY